VRRYHHDRCNITARMEFERGNLPAVRLRFAQAGPVLPIPTEAGSNKTIQAIASGARTLHFQRLIVHVIRGRASRVLGLAPSALLLLSDGSRMLRLDEPPRTCEVVWELGAKRPRPPDSLLKKDNVKIGRSCILHQLFWRYAYEKRIQCCD